MKITTRGAKISFKRHSYFNTDIYSTFFVCQIDGTALFHALANACPEAMQTATGRRIGATPGPERQE